MITFHAACVAIQETNDFWLTAFADAKHDTKRYLTLQRCRNNGEQDVELGMGNYHVERDDQGCSCYGGIGRLELHRDHIIAWFTELGAQRLKVEKMKIIFDLDDGEFKLLSVNLSRIFAQTDCLWIQV